MADQSARGVFETPNGQKYVAQLCKHWAHKPGTVIDEAQDTITFQNGNRVAFEITQQQLIVLASTPFDGDLSHWKGVVESHLKRFAFREGFALVWGAGGT